MTDLLYGLAFSMAAWSLKWACDDHATRPRQRAFNPPRSAVRLIPQHTVYDYEEAIRWATA